MQKKNYIYAKIPLNMLGREFLGLSSASIKIALRKHRLLWKLNVGFYISLRPVCVLIILY
jgi:hypothetical protein